MRKKNRRLVQTEVDNAIGHTHPVLDGAEPDGDDRRGPDFEQAEENFETCPWRRRRPTRGGLHPAW